MGLLDTTGQSNAGHHPPTLQHSLGQRQAVTVPCSPARASPACWPGQPVQQAPSSKPLQLPPSAALAPAAGLSPGLGEASCWVLASKSLLQLPWGSQGHLRASTAQKFKHLARPPHLWARTPASPPADLLWAAHPSVVMGFGCQGETPGISYLPGQPGSAFPSCHGGS